VLLSAVLFSAKSVLVKLAYQEPVDAITLLTLRMLFALPFFLVMAWLAGRGSDKPVLHRGDWLALVLLGIAGYYCASIFDFMGLRYISASLERLILFMYPTITVFLSAVFLKKPISRVTWLAIVVSYAGMVTVFGGETVIRGGHLLLGSLLVFASALSYAGYLVGNGEIIRRLGANRATSVALSLSCLCCLLHFLLVNPVDKLVVSPRLYGIALAMGFFCTVLPATLLTNGIRRIGASQAALIGAVGPVSTIYLGYLFLGEVINLWQGIGAVMVLSGVLIISLNK
jgi:drug/metabolite transporter (DMT)-like permease